MVLWPLFTWSVESDPVLKESDLKRNFCGLMDSIELEFQSYYAPRYWKEENNGWNLSEAIQEAKDAICSLNSTEIQEYQSIVKGFFKSTMDYHVGVYFLRGDRSWLPFDLTCAEGRYFISYIYRSHANKDVFPFEVGDELLEMGGKPVLAVAKQLKQELLGGSNPQTDDGIAASFLTARSGFLGVETPKGPVRLKFLRQDGSERSVQWVWTHRESPYIRQPHVHQDSSITLGAHWEFGNNQFENLKKDPERVKELLERFINPMMEWPAYREITALEKERACGEENPFRLGSKQSVIPQLGPLWWEADEVDFYGCYEKCDPSRDTSDLDPSPFQAYIYESFEGKRIGFIRLPHFGGWNYESACFGEILNRMEEEADALVLDQMYNPGGYLIYKYGLASMFATQPMETAKHRVAIKHMDVMWALLLVDILENWIGDDATSRAFLGEEMCSYPMSYQTIQMWIYYLKFIIDEWSSGHVLSRPVHLGMIDQVNPNPHYTFTKPVLMLINHMDFSCADFFPAIMQDNNRAVLMGTRTSGAGGCVVPGSVGEDNHTGLLGWRYTCTLGERPNGMPVEDLGVIPDVWYQLTADDVQNDLRGFVERIHEEVKILLSEEESEEELI